MPKEFIIYCDESVKRGEYYSNFYGGTIVNSTYKELVEDCIKEKMQALNLNGEIKWSKVTTQYVSKYIELIDLFFNFIHDGKLKTRIMFTDNSNEPKGLSQYHIDNEYFMLYYQFIKHAFGIQYHDTESVTNLRLYFDKLPDSREKAAQFKTYVHSLNQCQHFKNSDILVKESDIAEVDSRRHIILQCTDVILGAIQFRLNVIPDLNPTSSISSRTKAKLKLYYHILEHIYKIHPDFNVATSTDWSNNVKSTWLHHYRHWCFTPKNKNINKKKKADKKITPPSLVS